MRSIIEFLGYVPKGMLPRTEADQVIFCRAVLGLTQKELGQLLGVCDTNVSRWESGKNRPRKEYLQKLAEFIKSWPSPVEPYSNL